MSLETMSNPTFAAHQTFHPRFGWLKKGFDAVSLDPSAFSQEFSPVKLGVGKNMVEAIRFWSLAAGVIEIDDSKSDTQRGSRYRTSAFGRLFLSDENGLDPYIEDLATLWIIHWHMLRPKNVVPVWWLFFNDFQGVHFTQRDFGLFAAAEVSASTWKQPNISSIEKDVDALIRMYSVKAAKGRQTIDDLLDSPFRELGLLSPSNAASDSYRVLIGPKHGLSSTPVLYAALEFMSSVDSAARTISIARLTRDSASPGRVMKLGVQAMEAYLRDASKEYDEIELTSPAGSLQLVVHGDPNSLKTLVLERHYEVPGSVDATI